MPDKVRALRSLLLRYKFKRQAHREKDCSALIPHINDKSFGGAYRQVVTTQLGDGVNSLTLRRFKVGKLLALFIVRGEGAIMDVEKYRAMLGTLVEKLRLLRPVRDILCALQGNGVGHSYYNKLHPSSANFDLSQRLLERSF